MDDKLHVPAPLKVNASAWTEIRVNSRLSEMWGANRPHALTLDLLRTLERFDFFAPSFGLRALPKGALYVLATKRALLAPSYDFTRSHPDEFQEARRKCL